jgi:hypothetical protein
MRRQRSSKVDRHAGRLQYSLRSLLVVMTFCCLGLSLVQHLSFPKWFGGVLAVLAWSCLVAGEGVSALAAASGYRLRRREEEFWPWLRRRSAVFLTAVGAVGPATTFLLFVVAFSCAGLDVERLDEYLAQIRDVPWGGWRTAGFRIWMTLLFLNPASALLNAISWLSYFRPWQDFSFLLVRVFGLLSSLAATGVTLGFYVDF